MAEKQVMNDLDLENINGGMKINFRSKGSPHLLLLLNDPGIGPIIANQLMKPGSQRFPNDPNACYQDESAGNSIISLMRRFPDLIEFDKK